ncbi:MAG TPA: PfkB family carbohydrate kinase [Anaeromyxobacter sp.]|nr:PfkB family carbohydrate kinase [Anaeromyxobacter sp.]
MNRPGAPAALVCGNVTLDRAPGGFTPGGPAYYAARAWSALGSAARVLTAAAADFPSTALAGVEALTVPSPATTRFHNQYGPDGARVQRVEAAAAPLDPAVLPEAWRTPDVLHLVPVLDELDPAAFRAVVRPRLTGLCAQGLLRRVRPDGAVVQPPWDPAPALLAAVDVVIVGEDDLRGQGDLLARLARAVPIVAFTQGARGCELHERGRVHAVGVHPAREVDPTGAGDVFAAGFLFALAQGAPAADAARLGAAAASFVVEAPGGEGLPRVAGAFERVGGVTARR